MGDTKLRDTIQTRILESAERLFASRGIDGVSLRQIGAAAGSANHFVVQYHFGTKERLVRAIFERRLSSLEARRGRRLSRIRSEGRIHDVDALMHVMLRPLAEEVDLEGRCSYAMFLLSMNQQNMRSLRLAADEIAPLTAHIIELLYSANVRVPIELSHHRLTTATLMFLNSLNILDQELDDVRRKSLVDDPLLIDAVDTAAAAFSARPSNEYLRAGK